MIEIISFKQTQMIGAFPLSHLRRTPKQIHLGFEVLTVETVKCVVFWAVTLCTLEKS
jgi:hypothetical protein